MCAVFMRVHASIYELINLHLKAFMTVHLGNYRKNRTYSQFMLIGLVLMKSPEVEL